MKFNVLTLTSVRALAIILIAVLVIMTVTTVCLYPENLNHFGKPSFIWTISLLAAYLIFSFFIPAIGRIDHLSVAFRDVTGMGLAAGAVWIIHVTIEYFIAIPQSVNGAITLGFMLVLFVGFGVAAYLTIKSTGNLWAALTSGVWCAMLSILLLFVYAFAVNFIFMQHLMTILEFDEEYKTSGMQAASYTIHNTLESGGTHLLAAPIIAVLFSMMAAGIFKLQTRSAKN